VIAIGEYFEHQMCDDNCDINTLVFTILCDHRPIGVRAVFVLRSSGSRILARKKETNTRCLKC